MRITGSFAALLWSLIAATTARAEIAARRGEVLILRSPVVNNSALQNRLNRLPELQALGLTIKNTSSPNIKRVLIRSLLPDAHQRAYTAATPDELLNDTEIAQLEETCSLLKATGIATHCSPNYRYQLAAVTPNDPQFGQQYHTALMQVPQAWDITTGSPSVVIAVIDSGVRLTHPDLAANIWTNSSEVADGIDNDSNGFIDDLHGYDWVNSDSSPLDDQGHGTLVSGIIAAVGNNGIGVVGVNHTARLQVLKAFSNQGTGYGSDILLAIDYAVNNGADVINMSFGGYPYSEVFKAAIQNAGDRGVLVVCGAGNDSHDSDAVPFYPAGFDTPNNIAVAATDQTDHLTSFSNYGATTVDLAAPGIGIRTTGFNGGYGTAQGTSMAAPQVSGAAALVKAANSALTPVDIKAVLLENVDQVAHLNGAVLTGGRLNVFRAVTAALTRTPTPSPTPAPSPDPEPDPRSDPPEVKSLRLDSNRVHGKRFELTALALDSTDVTSGERLSNFPLTITCRESNGRKRSYRKRGSTNSDGLFSTRIAIHATKAKCAAQSSNGTRSNTVSLRSR